MIATIFHMITANCSQDMFQDSPFNSFPLQLLLSYSEMVQYSSQNSGLSRLTRFKSKIEHLYQGRNIILIVQAQILATLGYVLVPENFEAYEIKRRIKNHILRK